MIETLYDKFKHWSKNGSVWLIGDLHLGDENCKKLYKNWPSPKEQIEILKKTCNGINNTLIVLGDVGKKASMLNELSCYKVLIKGNHDKGNINYINIFHEIYSGPLFIAQKILLSHEPYPIRIALNIHGHVHNDNKMLHVNQKNKHINLAANVIDYTPKSLSDIIEKPGLKNIKDIHRKTINDRN